MYGRFTGRGSIKLADENGGERNLRGGVGKMEFVVGGGATKEKVGTQV